jgi:hypothetical protein
MGRVAALLLGVLFCLAIPACSADDIVFIPDPLPGDPRSLTVSLDQCDCDSCRVALIDPDGTPVAFDMVDPPVGQTLVADFCYSADDVRLIVECGVCSTGSPCTATATAGLQGFVGTTPTSEVLGSVSCTTLALAGASCGDDTTFTFATLIVNPTCPM